MVDAHPTPAKMKSLIFITWDMKFFSEGLTRAIKTLGPFYNRP